MEDKKVFQDRRFKLTLSQKQTIKDCFESGQFTISELSRYYKVSWATINFIAHPDKLARNKEFVAKRDSKKYYNTERNTINGRKYREHLRECR